MSCDTCMTSGTSCSSDCQFGPAEDEERSARKILTITERFSLSAGEDPKTSIAERVFDLEEESIKLKYILVVEIFYLVLRLSTILKFFPHKGNHL